MVPPPAASATPREERRVGEAAARRDLRTVVLPFYNARFGLPFTDADLADLTEFLLSL